MSQVESQLAQKYDHVSDFQGTAPTGLAEHQQRQEMQMKSPAPPSYGRGGYEYLVSGYPFTKIPIRSVVTTSFSADEEREDGHGRRGHRNYHHSELDRRQFEGRAPPQGAESGHNAFAPPLPQREEQQHLGRDLPPRKMPPIQESTDMRNPPHEIMVSRTLRVPPSPRAPPGLNPPSINRAYSAASYNSRGSLKRNFWHHAKSGEEYSSALPKDFMPPKRTKVSLPGKRDYAITTRTHSDDIHVPESDTMRPPIRSQPSWSRALSWEARDDYYHRKAGEIYPVGSWTRSPTYREDIVGTHWSDAPEMPSPRIRYATMDSGQYDLSPNGPSWSPRWQYQEEYWGRRSSTDEQKALNLGTDSAPVRGYEVIRRQGTFEAKVGDRVPMRFIDAPALPTQATMDLSSPTLGHRVLDRRVTASFGSDRESIRETGSIRLLALPDDRISLSETLCIVRENIEVFTATVEDVEAPAPGRKHPVTVGQVGLRCIHCRHTTRSSDRVKRAVCYPSSLKRIYRTVIDMKLDHFSKCKFVPPIMKDTLSALKANNTRSTGTTMQYFIKAAKSLGMVDGPSGVGVYMSRKIQEVPPSLGIPQESKKANFQDVSSRALKEKNPPKPKVESTSPMHRTNSYSSEGTTGSLVLEEEPKETFTGRISLSLPEDKMALSPLRCFLREQVCAFTATEEDIAVRTPTTFTVSVGQVGIGCIHCFNEPARSRLNRAVCFPFSMTRIYQSVADIQRFHLNECKHVPPDVKAKFNELQNASSKGSKGQATRQYWVSTARKIGLCDTSKGMRFCRDPAQTESKPFSLDILAQVASNVTTVNRPLILPEDKSQIAEFLYVVMEQLQACRFTDADRNKRRGNNVGCYGVECKHCAGKPYSRKFFWSSISAVESNFVSVHTHMMECKEVPDALKERLTELKKLRKEQTAALKSGSQKAFFSRVWKRLHEDEKSKNNVSSSESGSESFKAPTVSSPSVESLEKMNEKMAIVKV